MDFKIALSQIARGKASPVYLLHGARTFAMQVVDALRKDYVSPEWEDLNFSPVDGREGTAGDVVSLARTAPVGSGKRLVLVTDPSWLRSKRADPVILSYLKAPPDSSILVMFQEDRPNQQAFVKLVEDMGGLVDCSSGRGSVSELVKSRARDAGKDMTPDAVWALVGMIGEDADFADTEIDKIIDYSGDDPVIDVSHVEAVGFGHSEATVFDLVNAIVAGEVDKSIALAGSLGLRNEDPRQIMQTLAWQFRTMYRLKFLMSRDSSADAAAREAGLRPFQAKRFLSQSRGLSKKGIASCMEAILETGVALNSGLLDDSIAIETLIVRLRRCLAGGDGRPTSGRRR